MRKSHSYFLIYLIYFFEIFNLKKNKMSIMSNVKINFTHFTKNTEIQNGMYVKKMNIFIFTNIMID
jgi:hypothetical protein